MFAFHFIPKRDHRLQYKAAVCAAQEHGRRRGSCDHVARSATTAPGVSTRLLLSSFAQFSSSLMVAPLGNVRSVEFAQSMVKCIKLTGQNGTLLRVLLQSDPVMWWSINDKQTNCAPPFAGFLAQNCTKVCGWLFSTCSYILISWLRGRPGAHVITYHTGSLYHTILTASTPRYTASHVLR